MRKHQETWGWNYQNNTKDMGHGSCLSECQHVGNEKSFVKAVESAIKGPGEGDGGSARFDFRLELGKIGIFVGANGSPVCETLVN